MKTKNSRSGFAPQTGRLLARGELSFCRADLPARQPAAGASTNPCRHQAAPVGPLGHDAGLNFVYVHLNRAIKEHDLNVIYIGGPWHCGPWHGGPGMMANAYLKHTYSEVYPHISQDEEGTKRLFTQRAIDRRNYSTRRAGSFPNSRHWCRQGLQRGELRPGPCNTVMTIKRLTMKGLIVGDRLDRDGECEHF